ncbi:MAG: hypothetical protein M3Q71_24705 [Chloroflexota bacterium]|nr:hypothetical protein [Chloroflexota bacterium]
MTSRSAWLHRLRLLVVWALVTAGVSFLVARAAADDDPAVDVTAPLPPVSIDQRATVSLTEASIVPIVSAEGSVVQSDAGWLLEAPATSDELAYRLLDPPVAVKALINGGPSGFNCAWAGLGQAGPGGAVAAESARELAPDAIGVTMRCAIPPGVRVVAGMRGTMVLQMAKPTTVQALPVTAVVGSANRGQVVLVHDDGSTEIREVELGISDIYNIQILSGLAPGETVLQNPTQADFAQSRGGS